MKRFVILTYGRSGSEYLRRWLNNHPEVLCHGEMLAKNNNTISILNYFKNNKQPVKTILVRIILKYPKFGILLSLFLTKPLRTYFHFLFVDYHLVNPKLISVKNKVLLTTQGLKIAYRQQLLYFGLWHCVKKTKVIHLVRRNLLAIYVSKLIGMRFKIYHSNVPLSSPKIKLAIWNLNLKLCMIDYQQRFMHYLLKNSSHITVYYEDFFSAGRKLQENKIFAFLEIEKMELNDPGLLKIGSSKMADRIENYNEVVKKLKGTRFEVFLD